MDWEILERTLCQAFWAGHNVHWIEYFNVIQPAEKSDIRVRHIGGDEFLVEFPTSTFRWFHHEPARLIDALQKGAIYAPGEPVLGIEMHPTVCVPSGEGSYVFNMSREPLEACSHERGVA